MAEAEKAIALFGRTPLFLEALGHAYTISGRRTEALKIVAELRALPMADLDPHFNLATIY